MHYFSLAKKYVLQKPKIEQHIIFYLLSVVIISCAYAFVFMPMHRHYQQLQIQLASSKKLAVWMRAQVPKLNTRLTIEVNQPTAIITFLKQSIQQAKINPNQVYITLNNQLIQVDCHDIDFASLLMWFHQLIKSNALLTLKNLHITPTITHGVVDANMQFEILKN